MRNLLLPWNTTEIEDKIIFYVRKRVGFEDIMEQTEENEEEEKELEEINEITTRGVRTREDFGADIIELD